MRKVEVVPYDWNWQNLYQAESISVAKALQNVIAIHHIGSTAIIGIYAKPIIDILVEVKDINSVDGYNTAMETLNYQPMGFGIVDRRFFRKYNSLGIRTYHVHVFETNSPQVTRHLAFRDYMNAHHYGKKELDKFTKYLIETVAKPDVTKLLDFYWGIVLPEN